MKNILLLFAILLAGVVNAQNFSFRCVDIETCEGLVTETFTSGLGTATNNEGYAVSIPKATAIKYANGPVITAESLANANTIDISYKGVVYTAGFFSGFGFDTYYYRNDTLGALLVAEGVGTDFNTPFNLDIGPGVNCIDESTPVKPTSSAWWSGNTMDFYFPTFVTKHDDKYLQVNGRYFQVNGNGFEYQGNQIFQLPFNFGAVSADDYSMVTGSELTFAQRKLVTKIITTNYDAPGTQAGESPVYHVRSDDAIDEYSGHYWQIEGDNKAIPSMDFQGVANSFYSFDVFETGPGVRKFLVSERAPTAEEVAGIEYVEAFSAELDDVNGAYGGYAWGGAGDENTYFLMDEDWREGDLFGRRKWLHYNNRYYSIANGGWTQFGKYVLVVKGYIKSESDLTARVTENPNSSFITQMVKATPALLKATNGSIGRMTLKVSGVSDLSSLNNKVWQLSDDVNSNNYYQTSSSDISASGQISFVNIFAPYTRTQLEGQGSWYFVSESNPSGLKGPLNTGNGGAPIAIEGFTHNNNPGHSDADTKLYPLTTEGTWDTTKKRFVKIGHRYIYMDYQFERWFETYDGSKTRFVVQGWFHDVVEDYHNDKDYDGAFKGYYVMGRDFVPVAGNQVTHYALFYHNRDDDFNYITVQEDRDDPHPAWASLDDDAIWPDTSALNGTLYFQFPEHPRDGSFPSDQALGNRASFLRSDDRDGAKLFDGDDCGGDLSNNHDYWFYYSINPWNPAVDDRRSCISVLPKD